MRLALVLFALLCGACAQPKPADSRPTAPAVTAAEAAVLADANAPPAEKSIDDLRNESLAAVDRAACETAGGEVRQEGMLGMWRCVKAYADAGKACRGKSDCEGKCLYQGAATPDPVDVTGVCQSDDSPFGCYTEVENGKTTGGICVD